MAETTADLNVEIGVSLSRLAASLARAEARFNAATRKIERDTNAGTQRAADQMATNYARGVDRANAQTERLNDSVRRMNATFAGGGSGVQNMAFQIQDFAVQVGAGTAATTALAQQVPQLLGGFGPWGAVIGAATAIMLPLAAALYRAEAGAVSAEDAIKAFTGSVDDYLSYVETATAGTAELRQEFGAWASQVRGFAEFMAGVALDQSMTDLRAAIAPISTDLTTVVTAIQAVVAAEQALADAQRDQADGMASSGDVQLYRDALTAAQDAARQAADALGLTTDQVLTLNDSMQRLASADGMAAVASAAAEVAGHLESWFPAGAGLTDEMQALSGHIQEILVKSANAAAETETIAINISAAVDKAEALVSAMGAGVGVANSMANAVARIAANAWDAARAMAEQRARENRVANLRLGDDERGGSTGNVGNYINQQLAEEARNRYGGRVPGGVSPSGGGGGGGGGAARDITAEFARLMAQLDPVIRATQEFEQAQTLINEAMAAGAATAEEAAAAYKLAEERFTEATGAVEDGTSAWRDFEAAGASALDRLIEGTADWKDVLIDAMREFAIAQARAALLQTMPGADQNASLGTLLMQGLTSFVFPGRATGGPVTAGSPYMVGERGPEPFVPAVNGRILSVPQAQAAIRGGGGTTVQVIDQRSGSAPPVQTQRSRGPDGREIVRVIVAEEMARGGFDRSLGGRFGARPTKVVR